MTKLVSTTAVLLALAASTAQACDICNAPQFKAYTGCIDKAIPQWDPNGPVLKKANITPEQAKFAALVQCEPQLAKFAKKFGDKLASILQATADGKISEQFAQPQGKE